MGDGGVAYAAQESRVAARSAVHVPLRASELAWLAALPVAAIVVAAILLLGPPLSDTLFPTPTVTFWPGADAFPEPVEHARYLLALTAPLLLSGAVVFGVRRGVAAPSYAIGRSVVGVQVAALAFVMVCVVSQHRHVFQPEGRIVYFTSVTLWVAAAIALSIAVVLASDRMRARLTAPRRDGRGARLLGSCAACLAIAVWVTPGLNSERTIATANEAIAEHMAYWLHEMFAVLNGLFPLVDYSAQYGSLLPYPVSGAMALLGASIGIFTIVMSALNAVCMLAAYAALRRVARGTLAGLLLFLPFLATSFFTMRGPLENRYSTVNLFSIFPLRYFGPFVLLWLVTRHLDGAWPRAPRWLFFAAGLTVLNNGDFGVPALGATLAALLLACTPPNVGRLFREAAAGLAGALAAVSALTLLLAGSLPNLALLFRFSGIFVLAGFGMWPMAPTIGMSTIIFVTYVAAIAVATARALEAATDRLMTGLLLWSGVFGLGIGAYYMGRSYPEVLTNMLPAWALTVTLLFVVSVRAIAARATHRPTVAEVACLFAFGVLVCSLPQTPTPWSQIQRLQNDAGELYSRPLGEPFVAMHTRPGEIVAILPRLGHRTAYELGLRDVTPYAGVGSMPTVEQIKETLRALAAAGGRKVFLNMREGEWPGVPDLVARSGYEVAFVERFGMAEYIRRL